MCLLSYVIKLGYPSTLITQMHVYLLVIFRVRKLKNYMLYPVTGYVITCTSHSTQLYSTLVTLWGVFSALVSSCLVEALENTQTHN